MLKVTKNQNWDIMREPFMTVITPVYNRCRTIERTIRSVEKQTFRDIEYIIIDDGSTESIDDIIREYMDSTDLPVMFIKKSNGGVHTARNEGYRNARGKLVLCIDSDDELLPDACEVFYNVWQSIPEVDLEKYWQIKAQCVDEKGKVTGTLFPENINRMSNKEAKKYFSLATGEQIGCRVVKVMKENLFPEPEGVTFVTENIRWAPLEQKYRSLGINDVVRIYHKEGSDHLSNSSKKKTKQDIRNLFWNTTYMLNDPEVFMLKNIKRLKMVAKYCVFCHLLLKYSDKKFVRQNSLKGFVNNFWKIIFWVPASAIANFYYKKNIRG